MTNVVDGRNSTKSKTENNTVSRMKDLRFQRILTTNFY